LKATIVICTRRRPALLTRCLSAVARLDPAPSQVIVVDNSQGDKDTKEVARKFGARYTLEPKAGLDRARKRGLAESETEAVAFLDDDAVPETNWLATRMASSAPKKSTGSTGKVLNIDSTARKSRPRKARTPSKSD
jgi:glycosyltransferase involved in cell wall biosynthesis